MLARLAAAVLVASSAAAMNAPQEAALVRLAQRVRVSSLDSTLPATDLARWLAAQTAVDRSAIRWEVNDCGEGGDGRTAPTCVEAAVDLAANTTASVSLLVAARDGARVKPAIYSLSTLTGHDVTFFKTLHEWSAFVRSHRR
jgi:hypothetical protein